MSWGINPYGISLYGGVPTTFVVLSAQSVNSHQVKVHFSKPVNTVDPATTNPANYVIPFLPVSGVDLTSESNVVLLTTNQQRDAEYTVTVSGIQSDAGHAIEAPFSASFLGTPFDTFLSTFRPKGLSKTRVLVLFGSPMENNSAIGDPSSYIIKDFSGNTITVSRVTVNSMGSGSIGASVHLDLDSDLQDITYSMTISSSVKIVGGLNLAPSSQLFSWATPANFLSVRADAFSGEVTGGLYGNPSGMVFFSPSLQAPSPNSVIQIDEVDVCTTAYDTYTIPEEPFNPNVLYTYPSPDNSILSTGFVLFSDFTKLTQAKLNVSDLRLDQVPKATDSAPHALLREQFDPSYVSLLNSVTWALDPGASPPFITARNLSGPIPPGPLTEFTIMQTTWHINEITGDNTNDGLTSGTALQTHAELVRRLGLKARINQTVNVYLDSNITEIQLSYSIGPNGVVLYHGTRNITSTGTITNFTAEDLATEATLIEDSGRSSWTAGELLRTTGGSHPGAWCWIAKDKTGGVARTSRPGTMDLSVDFANMNPVSLSIGDPYETETLSTIASVTCDIDGGSTPSNSKGFVIFIDCHFPSIIVSQVQPLSFVGCRFDFTEMANPSGANCCWTGIILSTGLAGSEAGLFLNVAFSIEYGSQWFYNSHAIFQNTAPRAKPAGLLFFEDYAGFFDVADPITIWYGSRVYVRHGFFGSGISGDAIQVQAGGQLRWSGTVFSFSGQTNDVSLGGKTAIPRIDPTTNLPGGAPVTLSFTNIQTAYGSGGFGGSAVDLYSLAAFLEVPDAIF